MVIKIQAPGQVMSLNLGASVLLRYHRVPEASEKSAIFRARLAVKRKSRPPRKKVGESMPLDRKFGTQRSDNQNPMHDGEM